jgi:hypothetical protein
MTELLPGLELPAGCAGPITDATELTHNTNNGASGGIWRVQLPAGQVILKVARRPRDPAAGAPGWRTSDQPRHWNYWRREVLAYEGGLAATAYAAEGIAGPELIGTQELEDGSVALWLADATGAPGPAWPASRLGALARQLGRAQGRWAGRVPGETWLSRDWLAGYLADRQVPAEPPWHGPEAAVWPERVRAGVRRVWERRHDLLAAARAAPRTLCHLDVWPMNLIEAGANTVLLDWAFVGEGAIGEDISNLIIDSVTDGLIDAAALPGITQAVTTGYLAGLRDVKAPIEERDVLRAIAATGAAKYSWLAPAMLARAAASESVGDANYGAHRSWSEVFESRTGLFTQLVDWADLVLG